MVTTATYGKHPITDENICVNTTINGIKWSFPMTTDNIHYQAILEWVADGNTVEEPA